MADAQVQPTQDQPSGVTQPSGTSTSAQPAAAKSAAAAARPAARPKRTPKPRPVAVVMCNGSVELHGCEQGCIGCGACEAACRKGAIHVGERGVAFVDRDACIGCGLCARKCPQGIIQLLPRRATIQARCSNTDKGPAARKVCDVSCIACGACERACPVGAMHVENNHAVINTDACIACGMCAVKCPRCVIRDVFGIVAKS